MMLNLFTILGVLGLLIISAGILTKKRKQENIFYIVGGILLEIYSISIGETIFIILQLVFIFAATFDFIRMKNSPN